MRRSRRFDPIEIKLTSIKVETLPDDEGETTIDEIVVTDSAAAPAKASKQEEDLSNMEFVLETVLGNKAISSVWQEAMEVFSKNSKNPKKRTGWSKASFQRKLDTLKQQGRVTGGGGEGLYYSVAYTAKAKAARGEARGAGRQSSLIAWSSIAELFSWLCSMGVGPKFVSRAECRPPSQNFYEILSPREIFDLYASRSILCQIIFASLHARPRGMSAGVKRTLPVSFDTGLAVLDTPYQEHHRHGPPMAQASVAESLVALPPVKGAHHDHSQNPPEPFGLLAPASAGNAPGGATA